MKVGIPCMKCSLNPSQQRSSKTGKAAKTCGLNSAWREMNDERMGRDTTIDRSLTEKNVWMDGNTEDKVDELVQKEIDRINAERKEASLRALRKDTVSVVEIIEKPPIDYMQNLSYEEKCKFLSDSHDVMKELLQEWNPNWKMLESVQHHDEFGGLSAHNHSLVLLSSVDDNGVATMNAKKEMNLKFFNFINNNYSERMREKGYKEVEDCKTYDRLNDEEKEYRRLHPEEHGVDAYEYKQKKLEEQTQKIEKLDAEIVNKTDSKNTLDAEIRSKQEIKEKIDNALQQASDAKLKYESKLEELTGASVKTYNEITMENQKLQTEISFRDSMIESLTKERDHFRDMAEKWKQTAVEFKSKFEDISQKAGQKLMKIFGYDVSQDPKIHEFPTEQVAKGMKDMQETAKKLDPKTLRVIPSDKIDGAYRVVQKSGKAYETVKDGFATRAAATAAKSNMVTAAISAGVKIVKSGYDISKNTQS